MTSPRVPQEFLAYVDWLRENAPASHENLAPPASASDLRDLETVIGHELPEEVRAVLSVHNGQRQTMTASRWDPTVPTVPSLSLLSTELIAEIWLEWAELRTDPEIDELQGIGSTFPSAEGRVKSLYTSPAWIPLWSDPGRADYIGVDLDPDAGGSVGQVINFGRDEECHFLCASSYSDLWGFVLEEVRLGRWPAREFVEKGKSLWWLGDPDSHFFNALYQRFSA